MGTQDDYDRGFQAGYEDGKDGFFLTDIADTIGEGLPSIGCDPTYEKGFSDGHNSGVEDRPSFWDSLFGG